MGNIRDNIKGIVRRREIVAFVRKYWENYSEPPPYRKIMDAVGITSTSVMKYHVDILVAEGRLKSGKGQRYLRPANMRVVFDDASEKS